MTGKTIIALIVAFGVSLGLFYVVDTFVFKSSFDIVQELIKIVTVLVIVAIAGFVTGKLVHEKGLDVKVDGIKN